jgi:hypothetical protein
VKVQANLVEELFDLLELFWGEVPRIDVLNFTTKVRELGGISRRGKGQRGNFDGHGTEEACVRGA